MTDLSTKPVPVDDLCAGLPCITQDPNEPAEPKYLAVCTEFADLISRSVFCPPECGGHPICQPCYELALAEGLGT